jgi:hypothetical protein
MNTKRNCLPVFCLLAVSLVLSPLGRTLAPAFSADTPNVPRTAEIPAPDSDIAPPPAGPVLNVGLARIDITPDTPIRLSGYAARTSESVGVRQKLCAKALAIGTAPEKCLLITVDCTGLPRSLTDRIKDSISRNTEITPERIAFAASHSHTAPMIAGYLDKLFAFGSHPVTPDQQTRIDRYSARLEEKLLRIALEAAAQSFPARLAWTRGSACFAANRRPAGGPVDHDLPLMKVTDLRGNLRAVIFGYACHATTIHPADNRISPDWPGAACSYIEQHFPDATAMVIIGCGADSDPSPRGAPENAQRHGRQIADEVRRLFEQADFTPISGPVDARIATVNLKFAQPDAEPMPYTIQTWTFARRLAMVFLEGEVVVDYSLRLKDSAKDTLGAVAVWPFAYCNSVPGYVPSERVLREGGYEPEGSTPYYGLPGPFAPGIEDKIINQALQQIKTSLRTPSPRKTSPASPTTGSAGPSSSLNLRNLPRTPETTIPPLLPTI